VYKGRVVVMTSLYIIRNRNSSKIHREDAKDAEEKINNN